MMLQVKNLSKIILCTSLFLAVTLQTQAETTKNIFSVSDTKVVQFAPTNYTEGEQELFQWSDIENINASNSPWYVLSHEEWTYLLVTRDVNKNALGKVDTVNCLIILPDDFVLPEGVTFAGNTMHYDENIYTVEQWALMEAAGAVFLPCRGSSADGVNVNDSTTHGAYWAATDKSEANGYCVRFNDGEIHDQNDAVKTNFYSVRLVKETSKMPTDLETIPASPANAQEKLQDGQALVIIENNHIVIISNNEKYDVTGKKL